MKAIAFLFAVLTIVGCLAQSQPSDISPCGFCEFAVSNVEALISANAHKEDVQDLFKLLEENVCPVAESANLISNEKCKEWINTYGSYSLELLLSEEFSSASSLCMSLGICIPSEASDESRILFPTLDSNSIKFEANVKNAKSGNQFSYKVFIGTPSFEYNKLATVFEVTKLKGIDININIQKDSDIIVDMYCTQSELEDCSSIIDLQIGSWYSITVIPSSAINDKGSFSFKITQKDSEDKTIKHHQAKHHWKRKCAAAKIIIGVLSALGICCCCCCCIKCLKRRACKGRRCCRYMEKKPEVNIQQQDPQDVPLEPIEMVDPMTIPVSVYYPPNLPFPYAQQVQYIPLEQSTQIK